MVLLSPPNGEVLTDVDSLASRLLIFYVTGPWVSRTCMNLTWHSHLGRPTDTGIICLCGRVGPSCSDCRSSRSTIILDN